MFGFILSILRLFIFTLFCKIFIAKLKEIFLIGLLNFFLVWKKEKKRSEFFIFKLKFPLKSNELSLSKINLLLVIFNNPILSLKIKELSKFISPFMVLKFNLKLLKVLLFETLGTFKEVVILKFSWNRCFDFNISKRIELVLNNFFKLIFSKSISKIKLKGLKFNFPL